MQTVPTDPPATDAVEFVCLVERFYVALLEGAGSSETEPGLGGHFLYAGELDAQGRALLVAANIAGAASLAATAERDAQMKAIRDGTFDFLVTDLNEALRILKNQIRKREPVSVCVALAPEAMEREMLERGVAPDLVAAGIPRLRGFFANSPRLIEPAVPGDGMTLITWSVDSAPAEWMPKLDAIALDCVGDSSAAARRWLRLGPRYLGRLAQSVRVVRSKPDTANEFAARVQLAIERREIGVEVRMRLAPGQ